MRRLLGALSAAVLLFAIAAPMASASTVGESFVLHLECEDGIELDILVPSGGSYAGLEQNRTGVGVLKGIDSNGVGAPEFLVPGFQLGELTMCAAFSAGVFVFAAYVLFTPQGG
jgi:hypothetical protein